MTKPALFHFKQFVVDQGACAMKIGTDSVLLGSFVKVDNETEKVLDIGSGTGILALMLAQKCEANIDAVEIDEAAFKQATINFNTSKWHERLNVYHNSLQEFGSQTSKQYDLIISNPPFYRHLHNPAIAELQRSMARHDAALPFEELTFYVNALLKTDGKFWLILPVKEGIEFIAIAKPLGLHVQTQILVQPKPEKEPNRMVVCFVKQAISMKIQKFCIYDSMGKASKEYYELTKEYLLWSDYEGIGNA